MVIVKASVMGFCSGVRSAVHYVEDAIRIGKEKGLPVYTIGALIHNEQFLDHLNRLGVNIIEEPEPHPPGVAVVRAHGIEKSLYQRFVQAGFTIVDGTCPRVIRSQKMVSTYTAKHWCVVLAGDPNHGEVKAVAGSAEDPSQVHVVHTVDDVAQLDCTRPVLVLSQTTFSSSMFEQICRNIESRFSGTGLPVEIAQTICPATRQRQAAVKRICQDVEAMIIVGGKSSSNTKRLVELSLECGIPTWHINATSEIPQQIYDFDKIGLSAGASTPDWLIEDIESHLMSRS
jgi:4-hydroxy-3-methylbut-2-enyl diphosphate reductase